jgi:hypothetical protein
MTRSQLICRFTATRGCYFLGQPRFAPTIPKAFFLSRTEVLRIPTGTEVVAIRVVFANEARLRYTSAVLLLCLLAPLNTFANHGHSYSHRSSARFVSTRSHQHDRFKRSTAAKNAFKRQHPCPSTGRPGGSCPGYVIDHVNPLEGGGADAPFNMQWQTIADGKAKDKTERNCRL